MGVVVGITVGGEVCVAVVAGSAVAVSRVVAVGLGVGAVAGITVVAGGGGGVAVASAPQAANSTNINGINSLAFLNPIIFVIPFIS